MPQLQISTTFCMDAPPMKILLVEDNPDDEVLMLRELQRQSDDGDEDQIMEVHVARDGAEAVDYIFGRGEHEGRDPADWPTITLLDMKLPKLSGLDVLRQIRADPRTARMPVVIFTSSDEQKDIADSYDLGVNSYVRKPTNHNEFVEAVRTLRQYWTRINRNE